MSHCNQTQDLDVSLWPSRTLREHINRKENHLLHEQIVTAQGGMALNSKKGDLD